jgi:GNAT superfamily N-acetyltransferase
MIFADQALAQRIEQTTIAGSRAFIEASGGEWMEAGGTGVFFAGVESPLTQTFGLGLFEAVTAELLDQIEGFFFERGAPVFHEVSPLAGVEALALLAQRGYRPVELSSVLYMELEGAQLPAPNGISTERLRSADAAVWVETSARGWAQDAAFAEFMRSFSAAALAAEGSQAFLARDGGEPIATAVLRVHKGMASLDGASTVPEARRRGAQAALLRARLEAARAQGCSAATMSALPGSESQRNAERHGFRIAYTRTKWQLA